jgi:anthranilate synthase/aminodeoxychorismate synthase-like glutamine amidotransferase
MQGRTLSAFLPPGLALRESPMVLVIDNYDSFTYNLVQYLGELGAEVRVMRNDVVTLDEIAEARPDRIVISPGPGRPEHAGITMDVIRRFGQTTPILGVCLGHQAIGAVFGGEVVRAGVPMHGKTSTIEHDGRGVFAGIAGPFLASRYHSLIVAEQGLPEALEVTARTREDANIMGLRHRTWPVHGVQFHPESILTGEGHRILRNFLESQDGRAHIDGSVRP